MKWTNSGDSYFTFDERYLARMQWQPCRLRWGWTIIDRATRVEQASGGGRLQAEEAMDDCGRTLTELRRGTSTTP